jgi:transcriptional regulator with XRE-family HTH domain
LRFTLGHDIVKIQIQMKGRNAMDFAAFVKQMRLAKGISGRELSKRIGATTSYIGQLEKGHIKTPPASVAKRILEELEVENVEDVLLRFGIIKNKSDRLLLLFDQEEVERNQLIDLIESDLKNMPIEQVNAIYTLLNKHRDLLIHIYQLDELSKNMYKTNPMLSVREFVDFLIQKYGENDI